VTYVTNDTVIACIVQHVASYSLMPCPTKMFYYLSLLSVTELARVAGLNAKMFAKQLRIQ